MAKKTTHGEQIIPLKRIEGQVRGLQRMIEDERYCVDILIQIHSTVGAILRVGDKVFRRHLEGCVAHALKSKNATDRQRKLDEVMTLLKKFRRSA